MAAPPGGGRAMTILRLASGIDVTVRLSAGEALAALTGSGGAGDLFVELPGEDGLLHVRPSAVIAVLEDSRKGSAGFRMGAGGATEG